MKNSFIAISAFAVILGSGLGTKFYAQTKPKQAAQPAILKVSSDFTYKPQYEDFLMIQGFNGLDKKEDIPPSYKFISKGTLTNNTQVFYQEAVVGERISLYDMESKRIEVKLNLGLAGVTIDYGSLKPGETKVNSTIPYFMYSDFDPEILDFPISKVVLEQFAVVKDLQGKKTQRLIARQDITDKWKALIASRNEKKPQLKYDYFFKRLNEEIANYINQHKN